MKTKKIHLRSSSRAVALEPRLLFDGAGAVAAVDAIADFDYSQQQEGQVQDVHTSNVTEHSNADADTLEIIEGDEGLHIPANLGSRLGLDADSENILAGTEEKTLLVIDSRVDNYELLLEGLHGNVDVIIVDADQSGLDAISQQLAGKGGYDAIHIISHGTPGSFTLGSDLVDSDKLQENSQQLQSWADALNQGADILLYGCDVAQGEAGQSFIEQMAAITGADIAASTNATGNAEQGGDWVLESATGSIEAEMPFDEKQMMAYGELLANPQPTVTITGLPDGNEVFIGGDFDFSLEFKNPGGDGYGPYVDLFLPKGVDGDDGIDIAGSGGIKYLGKDVNYQIITLDSNGKADHPYAKDAAGAAVEITGIAGQKVVVIELPFGSFTSGQPAAELKVSATVNNKADLGVGLALKAQAGFRYGSTAVEDYATDPSTLGVLTDASTIIPTLVQYEYDFSGPEGETATGPNFPRTMTTNIKVAPGQTLTDYEIRIDLPDNVVVTHINGQELDEPLVGSAAANEVVQNIGNISGENTTFTLTYYIPDVKGGGGDVLDPNSGAASVSEFQVSGTGHWTPIDTRDAAGAQSYDPDGVEYQHSIKSLAVQKTVKNTTDDTNSPGDKLKYTLDFQVSDYFQFKDLVITDTVVDGHTELGTPELKITYEGIEYTVSLVGHYTETMDNTTHDVTRTYNISSALKDSSNNGSLPDDLKTGILTGGKFNGKDSTATIGSITYTAAIADRFESPEGGGDDVINHGDHISSSASISGMVVKVDAADGSTVTDDSATDLEIVSGELDLTIAYVNGGAVPADGIRPGDKVTYELTYDLANGDFEQLLLDAYLPKPVFDVSGEWTKDNAGTEIPDVGHWMLVSGGTNVSDINNQVTMSTDTNTNGLKFNLGSRDDPNNTFGQVKIRFTVKVEDQAFADGLFLTAQAQASDNNTPGEAAIHQDIDQIKLNEPKLEIKHGIVAKTGDGTIAGTTGTWVAPGSADQPFAGELTNVDGIDGNITNIDAGDKVVFAAGIINVGGHDAHNIVTGAFTVPEGFKLIKQDGTDAANLSEANLKVYLGDGTLLTVGTDYTVDASTGAITLNKSGVDLARGHGTGFVEGKNILVITYDAEALVNIPAGKDSTSIFTVESYKSVDIGGGDFLPGAMNISDTATATVKEPTVKIVFKDGKTGNAIDGSSSESTEGADMVIGEGMIYDIVVTLPEGTTHDLNINALVPDGMKLDTSYNGNTGYEIITQKGADADQSDALSANFAGTVTSSPTVSNGGGAVSEDPKFAFGNVTVNNDNASNNNSFVIRVRLIAANENTGNNNNQDGTKRTPNANLTYDKGGNTSGSDNDTKINAVGNNTTITIREPSLKIDKEVDTNGDGVFSSDGAGEDKIDAGDEVTYKVTVSHNADSRVAYDLTFSDTFDSVLDMKTGNGEWTVMKNGEDVSDQFEWVDNKLQTKADANIDLLTNESIFITVKGTANATVAAKAEFDSEATVTWSSIDSANASEKDPNERDGSGGVGTDADVLNNYAAKDGAPVGVNAEYTLSRVGGLADTVVTGDTDTDDQDVAVGEVVRFRLVMQLPEGEIPDLSMLPQLPDGYELVAEGATWALIGESGNTFDSHSHYLAGGDPGNIDASLNSESTPNAPALGGSATLSDGKFVLGDVKNTDNDNTKAEYIVLEFNAIVKNVTDNKAGTDLKTKVEVYTGETKLGESNTTKDIVVEPQISKIEKDVVDIAPGEQKGDPHQITVKNSFTTGDTNAAPAYDVKLVDSFPSGSNYSLDSVKIGDTTYPAGSLPVGVTATVTADGVELNFDKLQPGTAVEVIYTTKVATDSEQVADSTADATLTWSSLPGDDTKPNMTFAGVTGGDDGTATGERTGEDPAGVNKYQVKDSAGYGTISGTVWDDTKNRDDVVDADEHKLEGVTVTLKWVNTDGVERTLTTVTDADGNYSFGALPLGDYTIEVPAELNATIDGDTDTLKSRYDADGSGNGLNKIDITLTEGGSSVDRNFGYLQENDAPTVTFSDTSVREFIEGVNTAGDQSLLGAPVELGTVTIFDTELERGLDSYDDTTLTIGRSDNGTGFAPSADDVLDFNNTVVIDGANIKVDDVVVATFTNTAGKLEITFNANATKGAVNTVASAITYANKSQNSDKAHSESYNVPLRFEFNDANDNDKQGYGGELAGSTEITVKVIAQNDPPVATDDTNTMVRNEDKVSGNLLTGKSIKGDGTVNNDSDADSDPDTAFSNLKAVNIKVTTTDGPATDKPITAEGETEIVGKYGTLKVQADGTYEYVLDQNNPDVYGLLANNDLKEIFEYTLSDKDVGNEGTDKATLTITINGKDVTPPAVTADDENGDAAGHVTVKEAGLTDGTAPNSGDNKASGIITIDADAGLKELSINGEIVTIAQLNDLANNPVEIIVEGVGKLTITEVDWTSGDDSAPRQGEITYTFELTEKQQHVDPSDDAVVKDIALSITDTKDTTVTGSPLRVQIIDDAPEAKADEATVDNASNKATGKALDNDILGADRDVVITDAIGSQNQAATIDGDTGVITVAGEHGVLVIQPDGEFIYTRNEEGPLIADDVFTYTIKDADGDEDTATITIHIADKAPAVEEDGKGNPPTVVPVDPAEPEGPTKLVIKPDSSVNESGLPEGTTANDGSNKTTGTITVTPGDGEHKVIIKDKDDIEVEVAEGVVINTPHGKVTITGFDKNTGTITYEYELTERTEGDNTTDEFDVTITDQDGDATTVTVVVDIVDDAPQADPDEGTVKAGETLEGEVLGNDHSGADGWLAAGAVVGAVKGEDDKATTNIEDGKVVIVGDYGTLTLNQDGSYSYVAKPAEPGSDPITTDVFTYTVKDADGDTAWATLTIEIENNQPPVATPDTNTVPEDTQATGNLLTNDTDPDNDELKVTDFTVAGNTYSPGQTAEIPGVGSITINENGDYIFTPVPDWNGDVPVIDYSISDGKGGTAESTLTIKVTPVVDIADDTVTTPEGNPVKIPVLDNDSFDNSDAKVTEVSKPGNGTVVINPDGTVTYTPKPGFSGKDSFTYTVTSGGVTETATVTVTVEADYVPAPPAPIVPPVDTDSSSPLYDPSGGSDKSPLTGSAVITDPSVFHETESWDDVRRLPIPLHPVVYVNNEVSNSQEQREQADHRAEGHVELATAYEFGSASLAAGLGQDHNLFVSHAIRSSQGYSSILEDRVNSRLGRTNLSGDDLLASPELRQADPEQMVTAELFEQQQPTWISQPQLAEGDSEETVQELDEHLLAEAQVAGAAPSFTEQLRGGGKRLPMAARDKTFLTN